MSPAPTALVVFASTHGHTGRVAAEVAKALEAGGVATLVHDAAHAPAPEGFDAVAVLGSLHRGALQPELGTWVAAHRDALAARPSALVCVSLTAAEPSAEARAALGPIGEAFAHEHGWHPDAVHHVAGALLFDRYDLATRVLMRLIARRHGADTQHDTVYTDWEQVARIGRELAAAAVRCRDAAPV